jgi:hypothetical protein
LAKFNFDHNPETSIPGGLPNFPVISPMNVAKCAGCFALAYFANY